MVVMIEGAPGIKWVGARDAAQHFTPENDPAPNVDNAIQPFPRDTKHGSQVSSTCRYPPCSKKGHPGALWPSSTPAVPEGENEAQLGASWSSPFINYSFIHSDNLGQV